MSDKPKFPLNLAQAVADKIVARLQPACDRIQIAGSIRRQKPEVGDIEIIYIPKFADAPNPESLFNDELIKINAVDAVLEALIQIGSLAKRRKSDGTFTWGEFNKLAVAVKTGIPVDLFRANTDNWFNYLVCRTGSMETNVRIAEAAIQKHCRWSPYSRGFTQKFATGEARVWIMNSEEDVFKFVGLPYLEPKDR